MRTTLLMGALAAALSLALGCRAEVTVDVPSAGHSSAQPAVVKTARPARKTLRRLCTQPGQVEAFDQAPIFAKVSGYVENVAVDIGSQVAGPKVADGRTIEPGQVLATIAVPELRDTVRQKEALVLQAQARIEQAAAAIDVAKTSVDSAQARVREAESAVARAEADVVRWSKEYARLKDLATENAVTQKVVDETHSQLQSAEAAQQEAVARVAAAQAERAEAEARVRQATSDAQAARAQLGVAEADLQYAHTMLDYATIRAPFDGIVSVRNVNTGHLVEDGMAGGQPLFVVVRSDQVRVFLDVPEADAPLIRVGMPAELYADAWGQDPVVGSVTRTAWSLNTATRTLRTEIDLANDHQKLRPGMYVRVSVVLAERPDALVVPTAAVATDGTASYCILVQDGRAKRIAVQPGLRVGKEIEIVQGLTGAETLVVEDPAAFKEGQPVSPAPAAP